MKRYRARDLSAAELERLRRRPAIDFEATRPIVEGVIREVRLNGDRAVAKFAAQFDGVENCKPTVGAAEIERACARVAPDTRAAIERAYENVYKFHKSQMAARAELEIADGVTCFSESRPIERVGLYVPGGATPLPSTALMLAIPAQLAGCREIVLATPPSAAGAAADAILFIARLCSVTRVVKIGGAQAIAALAFGTESTPKVDKIFGPGNQFVTMAKMLVSVDPDGAAIDMPSGPTEVLVIADEAARPDFVASDLLSQAEHSPDAQAILVATAAGQAEATLSELEIQLAALPRRDIARQALDNSFVLEVDSVEAALDFANAYAPEHLILNVKNARDYAARVNNAGSVFLGAYACEAAGDYASGPNHSLPTYGFARARGGLTVGDFQKRITFQDVTPAGARALDAAVQTLAGLEALEGHRRAMSLRASG